VGVGFDDSSNWKAQWLGLASKLTDSMQSNDVLRSLAPTLSLISLSISYFCFLLCGFYTQAGFLLKCISQSLLTLSSQWKNNFCFAYRSSSKSPRTNSH